MLREIHTQNAAKPQGLSFVVYCIHGISISIDIFVDIVHVNFSLVFVTYIVRFNFCLLSELIQLCQTHKLLCWIVLLNVGLMANTRRHQLWRNRGVSRIVLNTIDLRPSAAPDSGSHIHGFSMKTK